MVDVGMRITHALLEAVDRRMGLGSAVQAVYQAPHSIQFWQENIKQGREGEKNVLLQRVYTRARPTSAHNNASSIDVWTHAAVVVY